jgi:predicted phosphodiesterase
MRTLDLGEIEADLLVFGGPYSNLQALRALRREAGRRGLGPDRCICTGDVVAYCADPVASVDEIRDWGVRVVAGNCEEQLAADSEECGCGFEDGTLCQVLAEQWYAFARRSLGADERGWMAALPDRIALTAAGRRIVAIHAAHDSTSRFIFASTDGAVKEEAIAALGADIVLAGHSGLPFTQRLAGGVWHNAGAIGIPANDGTPATWYSLMAATAGRRLAVSHHRLAYDHRAAAAAIRAAGLGEGYARALETGLWPSLDVLPRAERARTGRPIRPGSFEIGPDAGLRGHGGR